ncbi:MAG: 50S ribosomal protein L6 [Phycisphaerales bacterium]
MSRIGKQPVGVPAGVKATISGRTITIAGPQGTLSYEHRPELKVAWNETEKSLVVSIDEKDAGNADVKAHWGTTRALLRNMVEGVTKGYEKSLEVVGVGWTAAVAGKNIKLVVGYANPILVAIPEGVKVVVEKQIIRVSGADKQAVGELAAEIRSKRKPEPYNGKGIKYTDEVIKRKQGKQFGA